MKPHNHDIISSDRFKQNMTDFPIRITSEVVHFEIDTFPEFVTKATDGRLSAFTKGLGIFSGEGDSRQVRFYLKADLEKGDIIDVVNMRKIIVSWDKKKLRPYAVYFDDLNGARPNQVFLRYYNLANFYSIKVIRQSRTNPRMLEDGSNILFDELILTQ